MTKSVLLIAVTLLTAMVLQCSHYAGGTTDTGNAKVAATILTEKGEPVVGASVTICSNEYTSRFVIKSEEPRSSEIQRFITDNDGSFEIDSLESGTYNIEVNDKESGALLTSITVDDQDDEQIRIQDTIHAFARISGAIRSIEETEADVYVVVIGTDHYAPVTSDGMFELKDMPAGTFDLKVVASDDDWNTIEFNEVDFESGKTVTIDTSLAVPDTVRVVKAFLNTTAEGADISSNLSNFPVLIRISEKDSLITPDDEDLSHLRFLSENGDTLPLYVESFNAEAATAEVWVLVDTVYGNSDEQFIQVEIDTSESEPVESARSVFQKDHGYYSVYHLNKNLTDATENNFNGVDSNTIDTSEGRIGHARAFDGSSFFTVALPKERGDASITFWFKPAETFDDESESQGIWGKKIADHIDFNITLRGPDFYSGLEEKVYGTIVTKLEDRDTGYYLLGKTTTFSKDEWYHVAWCWGENGESLYINGELEASLPHSLTVFGDTNDQIGRSPYDTQNIPNGESRYFTGILDEFRFHSTTRGPDWVKLSYINQGDNDLLVKIVSEKVIIEQEDE